MSEWRATTLGAVCELKRGYDLPAHERFDGSVPIVSSSGITGYHSTAKVRGPGVVTGRYGTLGEVFYIAEDFWPLNTALYVRDFKGNDPRFVAALLRSLELGKNDGAAAVPGVNRNQLHRLPVLCPGREAQSRIGLILRILDDLIENSRRRIELLEQMAQAIYREWFIRYRFPGHEDVPLVDSPLGPIPEGWTIGTVADLCVRIQAGGTPSRSEPLYWEDGTVDWYKTGDLTDSILIYSSERISRTALGRSTAREFQSETILIAIYGSPTVGRLGLAGEVCSANQAALGLVVNPAVSSTEHLWFALVGLRGHLNQIAQGAAQQNVSKTKVASAAVVIPPVDLIRRFTSAAGPPWRLSHQLHREIHVLTTIRDHLLPRLVTGQIDVSNLDLDALVDSVA